MKLRSSFPVACSTAWRFAVCLATAILGNLHDRPLRAQAVDAWSHARQRMVDETIVDAGVSDRRVLAAMLATPRHEFVTPDQRSFSYYDVCLPIGEGQTISPPYMVASMTEHLAPQPTDKILEIGTGSGYQAAVLSKLVNDVYTIEIVESLGRRASMTLRRLGYHNVHTRIGDGYQGWPQYAPFDKIIVTCSPEKIPQPLVDQLKEGGLMAIPVGQRYQQMLYLFRKQGGKLVAESQEPTMFVPMTGVADLQREVEPDLGRPSLVNGGFEQILAGSSRQPSGWYYVRQGQVVSRTGLPEGSSCLQITNEARGRFAQALQGIGVEGAQVAELNVSLWVETRDVEAGRSAEQLPRFLVTFFDADRAPAGQAELGPWSGTTSWTRQQGRLKVPRMARSAVITVGLFGATGQVAFDAIELKPIDRQTVRAR